MLEDFVKPGDGSREARYTLHNAANVRDQGLSIRLHLVLVNIVGPAAGPCRFHAHALPVRDSHDGIIPSVAGHDVTQIG